MRWRFELSEKCLHHLNQMFSQLPRRCPVVEQGPFCLEHLALEVQHGRLLPPPAGSSLLQIPQPRAELPSRPALNRYRDTGTLLFGGKETQIRLRCRGTQACCGATEAEKPGRAAAAPASRPRGDSRCCRHLEPPPRALSRTDAQQLRLPRLTPPVWDNSSSSEAVQIWSSALTSLSIRFSPAKPTQV